MVHARNILWSLHHTEIKSMDGQCSNFFVTGSSGCGEAKRYFFPVTLNFATPPVIVHLAASGGFLVVATSVLLCANDFP